jgi:hypothetical protein
VYQLNKGVSQFWLTPFSFGGQFVPP